MDTKQLIRMEKDKIKKVLRENTEGRSIDPSQITSIIVMDFDGTTMDTLNPDKGRPIYKEKTGQDWPFKGWWGRPESLNMDVFDFQPIPEVKAAYNKVAPNINALKVSLTGRRPNLGKLVEAILTANGYKFDKYLFNYGSDTLSNKIEQLGKLLEEFPNVKYVALYDDRDEHVPTFKKWGDDQIKSGRLDDFNFTHVFNEDWTK